MWPWLLILAGTLIIVGALVARRRILRDFGAGVAPGEAGELTEPDAEAVVEPDAEREVVEDPRPVARTAEPPDQIRAVPADEVPVFVVPTSDPATRTVAQTAPTELLGPERPAPTPVIPPRPAFVRTSTPPPPTPRPNPAPTPGPESSGPESSDASPT